MWWQPYLHARYKHDLVAFESCSSLQDFITSSNTTTQAAFPNGPQSGPSGAHLGPNFAQLGPNRGPHGMLLGYVGQSLPYL